MFNTPILDIVIGLIFVFLLYSLLVTALNEAIATTFGLRAKMLKKGIVIGMLSDTQNLNMLEGFVKRIGARIKNFFKTIFGKRDDQNKTNLGAKFYRHPLIRNYGSSEFYPYPTYIPRENFSTVVLDTLRHEFDVKQEALLKANPQHTKESLAELSMHDKLVLLFAYYKTYYKELKAQGAKAVHDPEMIIDKDTLRILKMHLNNSHNDLVHFTTHLEKWFDDTMYRVTGWYKRQAQYILFALGLAVAIIFNVDTIEISGKLSKDKNLREQMVNAAIAYSKEHPDTGKKDSTTTDTITRKMAFDKWKKVNELLETDEKDLRDLIALGWGDYGIKKNTEAVKTKFLEEYLKGFKEQVRKNPKLVLTDLKQAERLVAAQLYQQHWFLKICFVFDEVTKPKKFFGLLLTAFAVSLGAPFWFDLLNKLINMRGSEKNGANKEPDKSVTVNVHKDNKTTD